MRIDIGSGKMVTLIKGGTPDYVATRGHIIDS